MTVPIGPDMTAQTIPFTVEQLRATYDRIELIDKHFAACCAFHQDTCHYGNEYDELYRRLERAGMSEMTTPCDRPEFEAWLATYQ